MSRSTQRLTANRLLRWVAIAAVLALAWRSGLTLAREPCLGVADIGDYWRVARPAGIEVLPQARKGSHVVCHYAVREAEPLSSISSAGLIACAARIATTGGDGVFDLRHLGLIYWVASVIILLAGLAGGVDALLVLIVAWVLYDPGYLLFFNSLYADPALIVGLAAALVLLLLVPLTRETPEEPPRAGPGLRDGLLLAGLTAAAAVAGLSKMQYSPFPAVLLACCALAPALARHRPRRGHGGLLAALLAIAVAAPLHFLYGPAPRFLDANNYNAIFGGIVKTSSDPAAALRALRVPVEDPDSWPDDFFAARRNRDLEPLLPRLRELSRVHLATLYLRDRQALLRTATAIHAEVSKVRSHPRGNYTRAESGRGPRFHRPPEAFSLWRTRLFHSLPHWSHLWLAATALFLAGRALRRRWRRFDTAFLFLLLWSASQFAVAVLGEGLVNLHQHLVGARLGIDLLVALTLGRVALWFAREVHTRRSGARSAAETVGIRS